MWEDVCVEEGDVYEGKIEEAGELSDDEDMEESAVNDKGSVWDSSDTTDVLTILYKNKSDIHMKNNLHVVTETYGDELIGNEFGK